MLCNHDQCEQHPSEITFKLCIISSMFQMYGVTMVTVVQAADVEMR